MSAQANNTLYLISADRVSLQAAVADCISAMKKTHAPATWLALLYSPNSCALASVNIDREILVGIVQEPGPSAVVTDLSLDAVFEARMFCEHAELRWLCNQGTRTGSAAMITESNRIAEHLAKAKTNWKEPSAINNVEFQPQSYLLWGVACPNPPEYPHGWTRLSEARIGSIDIPIAQNITPGDRVQVTAVEYLGAWRTWDETIDPHGNVCVLEERLTGLQKAAYLHEGDDV